VNPRTKEDVMGDRRGTSTPLPLLLVGTAFLLGALVFALASIVASL
jgi:hypothetical protein